MQAAGHFIGSAAKLTTGVKGGHDGFQAGFPGSRVDIHWNTPPVVHDSDQSVLGNNYVNSVAKTGHGLIHGIVQNLEDQVMEASLVSAADIHAWTDPDSLQPLQYLNIFGSVTRYRLLLHKPS